MKEKRRAGEPEGGRRPSGGSPREKEWKGSLAKECLRRHNAACSTQTKLRGERCRLRTNVRQIEDSVPFYDAPYLIIANPRWLSAPEPSKGTVKLSRILKFWRRNRPSVERRINNLGSGQGAE